MRDSEGIKVVSRFGAVMFGWCGLAVAITLAAMRFKMAIPVIIWMFGPTPPQNTSPLDGEYIAWIAALSIILILAGRRLPS